MVNFCPVPMIVQSVGGSQLESVFTFIMAMTALYTACLFFQMMMVLCPQERTKLYVFGTIQLAFKLLTIPAIQFGLSVSYIMVTLWLEEGKFLTCKMEIMTQYPGINIQYINKSTHHHFHRQNKNIFIFRSRHFSLYLDSILKHVIV